MVVGKFTRKGVFKNMKWINPAIRMLDIIESITTERARRELSPDD